MTRLKTLWMASAAIAALVIGLAATAQATDLRVSGITLAPTSTFDATMPAMTLKTTVISTSQIEQIGYYDEGVKRLGTAAQTFAIIGKRVVIDKMAGDNEAKTGGLWALTRDTVGFDAMKVHASTFELKTVINKAKHPAIAYAYMRFHSLGVGIG